MPEIRNLLEPLIPRLRRYARALTRDASRADDLVQNCLVRAIAKQHLWQEGTDLRAWLFTILHNLHVNEVRRLALNGAVVPIEEVASVLPVHENATDSVQLLDLHRAIGCLSEEQRQILLLVGLEELSTTMLLKYYRSHSGQYVRDCRGHEILSARLWACTRNSPQVLRETALGGVVVRIMASMIIG